MYISVALCWVALASDPVDLETRTDAKPWNPALTGGVYCFQACALPLPLRRTTFC